MIENETHPKSKTPKHSEGSIPLRPIPLPIPQPIKFLNSLNCPILKSSPLLFKAKPFKPPVIIHSFRRHAQTPKKIKGTQSLFQLRKFQIQNLNQDLA
jgi:hypothetical protein